MVSSKLNGFYQEKLGTPTSGGCKQESLASNYDSPPAIKAAQNGLAKPGSTQQVAEVFFATNYDIVRIVQTATLI
jgi:hypothetical protein